MTKTRLEPDGERAHTVTMIGKWRYHEQLGYDTIVERLNSDLERFPPPVPAGGLRARGAWSKSSVAEIVKNPKYTGYQVYNRRSRRSRGGRNRPNPPEMWVWSAEPAHEPLVPKWMFDAFNATSTQKEGSRDGAGMNVHRYTKRTYTFRGRVVCHCGRRMTGSVHKQGYVYYRCWPAGNNRGRPDKHADHPRTVYIREEAVIAAVEGAYSEFLFHPSRQSVLARSVDHAGVAARQDRVDQLAGLHRRAAELGRRQDNLLTQAEQADPTDPFTQGLRERFNVLQAERQKILDQIAGHDTPQDDAPQPLERTELNLLDALPHLALNLTRAPGELLGRLFELTQLRVEIHSAAREATVVLTLPRHDLESVSAAAAPLQRDDTSPTVDPPGTKLQVNASVNAVRAPGQARTALTTGGMPCDLLFRVRLPLVDVVGRRSR